MVRIGVVTMTGKTEIREKDKVDIIHLTTGPSCNDSRSNTLVDQGVHGDLGSRA